MKKLLHPIAITIYVLALIISLPLILPNKSIKKYSDNELREVALSRDMSAVPKSYEELLKVVDNPQNPLSREKISLGKKLFFDTPDIPHPQLRK